MHIDDDCFTAKDGTKTMISEAKASQLETVLYNIEKHIRISEGEDGVIRTGHMTYEGMYYGVSDYRPIINNIKNQLELLKNENIDA